MQLQLPRSTYVVSGIIHLCKFFFLGFLALLILLAAGYWEEDWRGSRAWAECQRDLQAKGESLDWNKFVPPPVPDERNLAMAPLFVRELHYEPDAKTGAYTFGIAAKFPASDLKDMPFAGPKPADIKPSGHEMAAHTDLAGYARYYRQNDGFTHASQRQPPEADVLLALTRYSAVLDELAQAAATRPLTRFPVDWYREDVSNIRLPHYYLEQRIVGTLRLRASARLESGQEEEALRDLELSLRLIHDFGDEHLLIGTLEQVTCLRMTLGVFWDGLSARRWSPASLERFQLALQPLDLLRMYPATIRRERAFGIQAAAFLQKRQDAWLLIDPPSVQEHPPSGISRRLLLAVDGYTPAGWYDLNKTTISFWMQDYLLGSVDAAARRIHPEKLSAGLEMMHNLPKRPTNVFAKFMVETLVTTARHLARAQTSLDQAVTACALERFFLDHQAYPVSLSELVPAYLADVPKDVVDGLPMRYHTTPDGRFQLYCVGWNGHDDGGRVVWNAPGKLKDEEGDWVWQYAALEPPSPEPKNK